MHNDLLTSTFITFLDCYGKRSLHYYNESDSLTPDISEESRNVTLDLLQLQPLDQFSNDVKTAQ